MIFLILALIPFFIFATCRMISRNTIPLSRVANQNLKWKKREETKMIRQISRRNTCRQSCRLFADEDRAELKRAKRTNTEGYVNCGGFLEAVSHTFGSWPMGEFVDATRMHILATHNHRGSSRWPWAKRTRSLKASAITIIGPKKGRECPR